MRVPSVKSRRIHAGQILYISHLISFILNKIGNRKANYKVNARGTFLITRSLLSPLGCSTHGIIINLVSGAAYSVVPSLSAYALSKLVALQIQAFVVAENSGVLAMALHPGIVMTVLVTKMFKPLALNTPALVLCFKIPSLLYIHIVSYT
jgi:short-subunit dehydrogenase